jgi:hypothetical protein
VEMRIHTEVILLYMKRLATWMKKANTMKMAKYMKKANTMKMATSNNV